MGKTTIITDEKIISAIFESTSIRKAAEKLGLTERQVYSRMKETSFKELYAEARHNFLDNTTARLQQYSNKAVDCLALIMAQEENAPQIRINAADAILRYCLRYTEQSELAERVAALETVQDGLSKSLDEYMTIQAAGQDIQLPRAETREQRYWLEYIQQKGL